MFSKQPKFTPKTLPKPKIRTVSVEVPRKPSTPVNGKRHATSTSSSHRPSTSSIVARGTPRPANGHPRASKSPFTSSDEKGYLAPPANGHKRIRSPATDSDRVAFDSDGDSAEEDDDDWESRLKRRKISTRMDPNRKLRHSALAELAANGYKDMGKAPKIVHAADLFATEQGDKPLFPDADPEDLVVKLQYPGSLTRERFVLSDGRDKLKVFEDITKVVHNVQESFLTPAQAQEHGFKDIVRQLERNSNSHYLNLAGYKAALERYNAVVLHLLKAGAIATTIDKQHGLSENLINHILTQVYDRVVTPKVDILKKYENGTDNVYGEMNRSFVRQALCQNLQMKSDQVFVDLGSGVGNVTLQAALEIGCESWGCEMMDGPAELAKAQHSEFRARCKLWGIQPGRIRFVHGDFTKEESIKDVLKRADVVLANNFAFTPELNDKLKIMFLDLKEGCKLVSLKNFVSSSAYHTNDIATQILDVEKYQWPEKGVSWTDRQGDYFIATKK
ncbi:histone-lysine N-methyltransferase [Diaporthe helianthi]|uniref:Histone-lysine N-methyltransferase, H3 lysine-79 specific n=1 Tax=Diaporthe helianthi TaxID=158607 RepID=A0A2P5I968_DIAHE|nr:histone-lysine N-methyltransferase [Diaporthe helianthi]